MQFINTSANSYRYIGLIFQALPAAKVIFCDRNSMDHCLCMYFTLYERGHGHDYSYDLNNLASYYANVHDLMAHWRKLYGDKILSVGYEDLVRNPVEVGARLYDFCGLDYDPAAISHGFTTDEIGRAKRYGPDLDILRRALGALAE